KRGHEAGNLGAQVFVEQRVDACIGQKREQRLELEFARDVDHLEQQQLHTVGQWQVVAQDTRSTVGQRQLLGHIEHVDPFRSGEVLDACQLRLLAVEPG